MPKYFYKLLNKNSKLEEGVISAWTKRGAESKLKRDGSTVILISREGQKFWEKSIFFPFSSGFSATEKINFFRNLAEMNSAGVSVVESLEVLSDQVRSPKLKKAILTIAEDVRNGQRLSNAMAKHPKYFSEFLVEMVNMGDLSGRLTDTLDRISTDLEKDDELKKKIRSAMAYPSVIIVLMVVISVSLVIFILPHIESLFIELGAPLPLPTKILLLIGDFLTLHPIMLSGILIGIIILVLLMTKTKKGRYLIHSVLLKIPVFGPLTKEYNLVLFFRSLEALIKSGISIVSSVEIAEKTVRNDVYKRAIEKIPPVLLHGVPFADALKLSPNLFPSQTQKIISIGEQIGVMEDTLKRTSDYYERSVDYKTRMMITLIEPVLMVILGIVVAGLALSIFLPLYQAASVI